MKYTIVTVNYNNASEIGRTIESVLNQTCTDYEYIIMDGLSTDNSVEIAKSYIDKFAAKNVKYTIISEKDNGVYNAMNKSINIAQGEYINFMNSGDCFASHNVLANIYDDLIDCDVLYGNHYTARNGKIEQKIITKEPDYITTYMTFSHQSIFVKVTEAKEYRFNEEYKISADYDMLLRMYIDKKIWKRVAEFVSIYDLTGMSSKEDSTIKTEADLIRIKYGFKEYKKHKFARKYMPKWLYDFAKRIKIKINNIKNGK